MGSPALRAQELGPTLLSYRAPEGCPQGADFQRSVQRRSARVRFVTEGAHDRELSIAMRKDGDFTQGELRLLERDGSLRQRSVRFTTCAEAVEGLALIAVVSLDPQALLEPETPAEPVKPPTETKTEVKTETKTEVKTKTETQTATRTAPKRDAVPGAQRSKIRLSLGAELNVAPRALPEPAFGGSLFADLASRSESWYAPLFRVAFSHVERRGLSVSGPAEANFTLTLATVSACPLRAAAGFLVLRPCAFGSVGALHTWGTNSTNLQQRTRPYGVWGGSVLLLARISQAVDMVADLAVGATVVRDTFGFDPDPPWQTEALYLSTGIGARFVFP